MTVLPSSSNESGLGTASSSTATLVAGLEVALINLINSGKRQIGELLGGQQQRVFLGRSLAQQAEFLFFDEPFVGVDKKTEAIIF